MAAPTMTVVCDEDSPKHLEAAARQKSLYTAPGAFRDETGRGGNATSRNLYSPHAIPTEYCGEFGFGYSLNAKSTSHKHKFSGWWGRKCGMHLRNAQHPRIIVNG